MSKLANELLLIKYLSNGIKYTLKELALKLEVTERMVRTYKEDLEMSGFIIETIKGPYGGYVLKNHAYLPNQVITKNDYALLEKLTPKTKEIQNLIQKLKCLAYDEEMSLNTKNSTFKIISRAIKEKRKVKITYYTEGKKERERIIHPFHLIYYGSSFGCAAFCETKKDLRHFSFDRIKKIILLNEFY